MQKMIIAELSFTDFSTLPGKTKKLAAIFVTIIRGKSFYCTPPSFSYHILSPILKDENLSYCPGVGGGGVYKKKTSSPIRSTE